MNVLNYRLMAPVTNNMGNDSDKLQVKLKSLPTQPGVYLLKNARGKVIYIGKGKNIRNRVRTAPGDEGEKTGFPVGEIGEPSLRSRSKHIHRR